MISRWQRAGFARRTAISTPRSACLKVTAGTTPACFHAQQAVEKYLKGLLALREQPSHRTHNLEEMQHIGEALPGWPVSGLDLTELSSYAVEIRHDFEFWPDRRTAEEALHLAEHVRKRVLDGIPKEAQP